MKSGPIINRILFGLLGLLFVLGLVLSTVGTSSEPPDDSVASTGPGGRRAAFLMLEELGFEPRPWRKAPLSLPQGEHVLWMSQRPLDLEPQDDEESPVASGESLEDEPDTDPSASRADPQALASDPRHPMNYAEFVRDGGTLVIPWKASHLEWLRVECGLEVPEWEPCELSSGSLRVELDTGETLSVVLVPPKGNSPHRNVNRRDGSHLEGALPIEEKTGESQWDRGEHERLGWHDLATGLDGRPFASWVSIVYGRVVLVADDGFLRNDTIGAADNGLLCTRLAEALERDGGLLFDEFALGLWTPPGKGELLLTPGVFEVTYHGLLALLIFVLLHSWSREFPRDPSSERLNPRLRVLSQARLFERAKRYDLLAHELRLGMLRRIVKRAGLTRRGRTLHEDTSPGELADLAGMIARQVERPDATAKWRRAFGQAAVTDVGQLDALGRQLDEVEKSVASGKRRANTGPPDRS